MGDWSVDFLCRHCSGDNFDCGEDLWNAGLINALERPPDPAEITHLVAHRGDFVVRGYVTVCDLAVDLEGTGEPQRCFVATAIAVDRRYEGGSVGTDLLDGTQALLIQRQRWRTYEALVVFIGYDDRFKRRLRRLGFREAASDPLLWFRRLRS